MTQDSTFLGFWNNGAKRQSHRSDPPVRCSCGSGFPSRQPTHSSLSSATVVPPLHLHSNLLIFGRDTQFCHCAALGCRHSDGAHPGSTAAGTVHPNCGRWSPGPSPVTAASSRGKKKRVEATRGSQNEARQKDTLTEPNKTVTHCSEQGKGR